MRPTTDLDDCIKPGTSLATRRASSRKRVPSEITEDSAGGAGATTDGVEDSSKSSSPVSDNATKTRSQDGKRPSRGSDTFNLVPATQLETSGPYKSVATPQRDKLTGAPDTDTDPNPTTFVWEKLGDSRLTIRGRAGWDVVEGFTPGLGKDKLDAPDTITTTSIASSNGTIRKLVAGQITAKVLSKDKFLANQAAAFECKGFDGLFVAFNDGRAGYQSNSDTLLFLEGLKRDGLTTTPIEVI